MSYMNMAILLDYLAYREMRRFDVINRPSPAQKNIAVTSMIDDIG